jgi:hypothetical protein
MDVNQTEVKGIVAGDIVTRNQVGLQGIAGDKQTAKSLSCASVLPPAPLL